MTRHMNMFLIEDSRSERNGFNSWNRGLTERWKVYFI